MRLVAFGCSLTYGAGLSDCFEPPDRPGPHPSKKSWPSLIANTLGIECVNRARTGASNKEIWHNIISFKFQEDDIVFIMWSYPERTCVLHPTKDKSQQIGIWSEDNDLFYKKFHSKYDAEMMSKLFVNHANLFLENKKLKVFNLVVDSRFKYVFDLQGQTVEHIPVYIWTHENQFPLSADNNHGNEQCHAEVARLIMDRLDIDHSIPKQQKLSVLARIERFLKGVFKNVLE
jgi:hypothetical protein